MFMFLCDMNGLVSGFNFRTREMTEKMLIAKKEMNMKKKSSDIQKEAKTTESCKKNMDEQQLKSFNKMY